MVSKKLIGSVCIALGLGAVPALAQLNVTNVDSDTLRVVDYQGKPPHKRLIISQDQNPELYAHYAALVDYEPMPLFVSDRRGAPGKSLPRSVLRVTGDYEMADIARFEESDSADADTRAWRGAPGKGRRLAR